MIKIAYIGFGSLARQIQHFLKIDYPNAHEVAFDDTLQDDTIDSRPFHDFDKEEFKDYQFYVCLGYQHLSKRLEIIKHLLGKDRKVPYFKHSSVIMDPSSKIGNGTFIFPGCILDQHTVIGLGTILHNGVIISHDSKIGACSYFSPGVIVSGNVTIGQLNFFGSGSILRNNINIGDRCEIGMGSNVVTNLEDECFGYGNPFKKVGQKLNLS